MRLDEKEKEELAKNEEVSVVEDEVQSEEEEEWPSLSLDEKEKEELAKNEEVSVIEDEAYSEEELPSTKSIPHLNISASKATTRISQSISKSIPAVDDSSSLGELRFKD